MKNVCEQTSNGCASADSSPNPTAPGRVRKRVVLHIRSLGHIPSFKNSKMIIPFTTKQGKRSGRPVTKPEYAAQMELIIQSIASQLRSVAQTIGGATAMGHFPPSLIASFTPLDDSRQWIVDERVIFEECPRGDEGATIVIEIV